MIRRTAAVLAISVLGSCANGADPGATILVTGDSVPAWNGLFGASVGHRLAEATGQGTVRAAVPRAGFLEAASGDPIGTQYRTGPWDWVIVEGGANDLFGACGCDTACAPTLDAILSPDSTGGAMADLVARARSDGARVAILGYYPGPRGGGPFSACEDELTELDARAAALAARDPDILFYDMERVIDPDNRDHYDPDRVHPSATGSALIAQGLAAAMAAR